MTLYEKRCIMHWSMPKQTTNKNCASIKFRLAGFSLDRKEVFILLHRHLDSAGIGVNLKATRARQFWSAVMLGINDLLCSFFL